MVLLCIRLTGCADGLLDEIPRDLTVAWDETEEAEEDLVSPQPSPEEEKAPQVDFLMEEAFSYAYASLNETEQIWYRDIEQILGGFAQRGSWTSPDLREGWMIRILTGYFSVS